MPARALPGTTVRLVSSGVPAIIHVTLAAGISVLQARRSARMRSEAGAGTLPISEECTSTPSPARSSSSCRPLQPATTGALPSARSCMSKSSAQSARSASRCSAQNARQPRAAELLLARPSAAPGGTGSRRRRTRAGCRPARPWSWRRRARRCGRRRSRPRTGRATSPRRAAGRRTCRSAGRSGPGRRSRRSRSGASPPARRSRRVPPAASISSQTAAAVERRSPS